MNTLYAFIDKNFGLSFAGKRPTYDYKLMTEIVDATPNLAGSEYSIQKIRNVVVSEGRDDLLNGLKVSRCLKYRKNVIVELQSVEEINDLLKHTKNVVLYMWDSTYPATVRFPRIDNDPNWICESTCIVEGSSHNNVTKYNYVRRA